MKVKKYILRPTIKHPILIGLFFLIASVSSFSLPPMLLSVLKGHKNGVRSIAFSADGQQIIIVPFDTAGAVKIWNVADEQNLLTVINAAVLCASLSHDKKWLVTGDSYGKAKVWNANTGEELRVIDSNSYVMWVTCSPVEPLVAMLTSGTHTIWRATDGEIQRKITFPDQRMREHTAFNHNGTKLVTVADHMAQVWTKEGEKLLVLTDDVGVRSALFTYDDQRIITLNYRHVVKVWDSMTGELLRTENAPAYKYSKTAIFTSPAGARVFSRDGRNVKIADAEKGTILWNDDSFFWQFVPIDFVAFDIALSPDYKMIATPGSDRVNIWQLPPDSKSPEWIRLKTMLENYLRSLSPGKWPTYIGFRCSNLEADKALEAIAKDDELTRYVNWLLPK